MNEPCRLALDIGGSFIKYGVASEDGRLLDGTVGELPSRASGTAEEIYGALREVIETARAHARIASACVSMPGPFDFDAGVSHMTHKFPALLGKSLRPPFEELGVDVRFLHDSTAFLLGEYCDGSLRGARNPCCVMLGTGLGFAFMREGRVCVDATQTPAVRLWNRPYRDGIAEDYVSTRALTDGYDGQTSVREIAALARRGDERARETFRAAGRHLSALLNPLMAELACDRFALGGQIARSADLLELELSVPWSVSAHLDDAALRGAAWYARMGKDACVRVFPAD